MKKTIGIAAGALVAVLGLATLTAFAGGGCHGHRHGRDPAEAAAFATARVDDALDDLDATPDQRTRIHAVKDRMLAAGHDLHAGNQALHETLLQQWKSDAPNAADVHALVDQRIDALRAFAHQAVDAGVEVHGILGPEQRAKLTKKMERWHR